VVVGNAISAKWDGRWSFRLCQDGDLKVLISSNLRGELPAVRSSFATMGDRGYPQPCYCMITQALMVDPVIDAEGNSYERDAIERWLQSNSTSPVTRNPLRRQDLRENLGIRETIRQITAARQQGSAAPAQSSSAGLAPPSYLPSISDSGGVDFSISACDVPGSPNEKLILLESTQPEGSVRTPVIVLFFSFLFVYLS
jgi:hypothetical protein